MLKAKAYFILILTIGWQFSKGIFCQRFWKGSVRMDIKAVVEATEGTSQYDENAKMLLAQKPILALILVHAVEEFKGMDPKEAKKLIEGEPLVGTVPMEPGFTNHAGEEMETITGMNSENRVRNEGVVYFDIIFYVRTREGRSKVIIGIEAQKEEPDRYDLEMRGIFYAVREISSQLGREFSGQRYNDIKHVYSIWVVMNSKDNTMGHIHLAKEDIIGTIRWKPMYDLMHVVVIRLKDELDEDETHVLHRLLGALFISDMEFEERNRILGNELGIEMEGNRKEMLNAMCNLGEGIAEKAAEKATEKAEKKMLDLMDYLISQNRLDDLKKAREDKGFRDGLVKEYEEKARV